MRERDTADTGYARLLIVVVVVYPLRYLAGLVTIIQHCTVYSFIYSRVSAYH